MKIQNTDKNLAPTLDTRCDCLGVVVPKYSDKSIERIKNNIVDGEVAPTITANSQQSINHQNCILIRNATKQGFLEANEGDGIDISGRMQYHRGNVQKGLAQTLSTMGGNDVGTIQHLRIRKLHPIETTKLMGFEKSDFDAMRNEAKMSDAKFYHCCGDSIVVSVLVGLFGALMPISEKELIETIEEYSTSLINTVIK